MVTKIVSKRKNNPMQKEPSPTIERYLSINQDSSIQKFNCLRIEKNHLKNIYYFSKIELSNLTNSLIAFEES